MAKKNKQQKKMQRGCPGPGGMGYGYPPPDAAAPPYGGGPEYGMGPDYGAGIPPQGGYGGYGGYGGGPHPHAHQHGYGYGYDPASAAFHHSLKHQGYGYGYGYGGGAPGGFPGAGLFDDGLLQGMPAFLRSGNAEQFLLGAVLGASAAWVLADEELRGKLIKAGMKLYAGIAGGFEEMKEQMADIKAEVATERHGDT